MRVVLDIDGEEQDVLIAREGQIVKLTLGGETFEAKLEDGNVVNVGGHRYQVKLNEKSAAIDGVETPFRIVDFSAGAGPGGATAARGARIKPPMPGKIVSVAVQEGDEVKAGQVLVILEAMKMQNEIPSPGPGTVKKVHVKPGQNVEGKDILIEIE